MNSISPILVMAAVSIGQTACKEGHLQLRQESMVTPEAPRKGEPIALIGDHSFFCAERHDAPVACVGTFPFSLKPMALGPYEGKSTPLRRFASTEVPWAIRGLDVAQIVDYHGPGCIRGKDNTISCWVPMGATSFEKKTAWGNKALYISGSDALCGVTEDSTIVCETDNQCKDKLPPSYEIKDLVRPTLVAASDAVHCGAQADGRVKCWGDVNDPKSCSVDTYYISDLNSVVDLHGSEDAFCALSTDNTIKCWGDNYLEYLGVSRDKVRRSDVPLEVPIGAAAVKLRMSYGTVIALTATGELWTWGRSIRWDKDDATPKKVEGIDNAIDIVPGHSEGCALLADHEIRCFGFGLRSRLTKQAVHHEYEDKSVWITPREFTIWPDAPSYEDEISK